MEKTSDLAAYLLHQGTNFRAFDYLGVHREEGRIVFRVWAPNALSVFAVGDFNGWSERHPLVRISAQGVWEGFADADALHEGDVYKFKLYTEKGVLYKADPYARRFELPPATASVYCEIEGYPWRDAGFLAYRKKSGGEQSFDRPMNIYEMHLGSWMRRADGTPLGYLACAEELAPYLKQMGYTHVELLPIAEHPFEGSWGYQVTGYFAPSARYGTPHELMAFVDKMHEAGIGVLLDWVPAHFPKDENGLYEFDGKPLYEYQGTDRMEHHGWGTRCFDVGREEVQSFLISNALFWLEKYHIDGLRVDAVASMLYLDYDRLPGEWVPNVYGDNKNLEAIAFFGKLNAAVRERFPDVLMIAEESTAWGGITGFGEGRLGFTYKWNMGWMNDTLDYAVTDPIYRKYAHNKTNFSLTYAFSERFILPISHDEVVHGKKSFLDRMPGSYEEKFAGARVFLAYMMAHPGKKLNFMGNEIAQFKEWDHDGAVEWFLLDYEMHAKYQHYTAAINHFYLKNPALWQNDDSWEGFTWLDADNADQSVLSFCRWDRRGQGLVVLLNFTPVERRDFRQGLPFAGIYEEVFSSDAVEFGGGGICNGTLRTERIPMHGRENSAVVTLPALGAVILRCRRRFPTRRKGAKENTKNTK